MAVRAPSFTKGLEWFNSPPLLLSELKGRFVLLEFFTFGCVNCMNNIRTVKSLHEEYNDSLTVIGIHTGKFTYEKESKALQEALLRFGVTYTVVNDTEHVMSDLYAAKGWPTTILIDEKGYVVEHRSGEQSVDAWKTILEKYNVEMRAENVDNKKGQKGLSFPQKVLTTPDFLAVANTKNNEVWLSDYDGRVFDVIEVDNPMGMAFRENRLYICESSAGRVICYDLKSKKSETVLENLRNPFDLAISDTQLVIALAGSHLINTYSLDDFRLLASYGNRFEALRDGKADACQLAQPSGMALMDDVLYFVDAESSSLRKIENGEVSTLIGEGL
ncbi:MAG: redoxin domain-containing protein, partial [Sulfurimonadaceae bacterium]